MDFINFQSQNILKSFGVSNDDSIEKSDILDALNRNDNVGYEKTGAEIKAHAKEIFDRKQADLLGAQKEAQILMERCSTPPTAEVPSYWLRDIHTDVGFKIYNWDDCRFCHTEASNLCDDLGFAPSAEQSLSEEECKMRDEYNRTVEKICKIVCDIFACGVLMNNLRDEQIVRLSTQQAIALNFS